MDVNSLKNGLASIMDEDKHVEVAQGLTISAKRYIF